MTRCHCRTLQEVDVDVATLPVLRDALQRPLRPEHGPAVERELAPQVLVLAVVAVVGLNQEPADVAAPVGDVELVGRPVAAVVLPQPRPLLQRPVRAVGRVAGGDHERQLRARVRLAAVAEAPVVGHLALPAAGVVALEAVGPVDGAPVEDVAWRAADRVGHERDVPVRDAELRGADVAIDDLGRSGKRRQGEDGTTDDKGDKRADATVHALWHRPPSALPISPRVTTGKRVAGPSALTGYPARL